MPGPHMTAAELAEELGRRPNWLHAHWRRHVKKFGMPAPLNGGAPPLAWSRAQIVAWLDRDLPLPQQAAAAAYRAAAAAATETRLVSRDAVAETDARARLDARFLNRARPQ